jgi:hypothetical protein
MKKKKAGQKRASPLAQPGKMCPQTGNAQNAAPVKLSLKWWSFKTYSIYLPCKPISI